MSDDGESPPSAPYPPPVRPVNSDESASPLDLLRHDLTGEGRWSSARPLVHMCGGVDALLTLDASAIDTPRATLEVFDDDGGPLGGAFRRVHEALTTYRFDAEYRAIVSRIFEIARTNQSRPLERRSDPKRIAAAIAWIALMGNMEIGRGRRQLSADLLWYELSVTSCADLGRKIAADLGMRACPDEDPRSLPCADIRLGDVALLHTSTRAWIVAQRDATARAIHQIEQGRAEARPFRRRQDGLVQLRGLELGVLAAVKVQPDGQQRVMVLLGSELDDPEEIVALTVPAAHRLVQLITAALHGPPAAARAVS